MEPGVLFLRDLAVVLGAGAVAGLLCRALKLPLVLGYLVAGALLSPHGLPIPFITDQERVLALSQLGLVFLIFSIGLSLGVHRIRRLGWSVAVGGWLSAILMFNAGRALAAMAGWTDRQGLFLAGVIMISSSAIISRLLDEYDMLHERHGQMALGVIVLEDITVVIMLTLLGSITPESGGSGSLVAQTLGKVGVFMVFAAIAAFLLVPRLMLRLRGRAPVELQNVIGAAMLLGASLLAVNAGFSVVLGAFLLGCVLGSTQVRPRVERVTEGLRDLFGAVFFVSTGMLMDVRLLGGVWQMALLLGAAAILIRIVAVFTGLFLAGRDPRDSLRSALCVTPLGEFSFVVAGLGVDRGVMPEEFYPMAVAMSLLSIFAAPVLVGKSVWLARGMERLVPGWLREAGELYAGWRAALSGMVSRNLLWKLSRKRLIQVGVEMLFVSGALLFATPVHQYLVAWAAQHFPGAGWIDTVLRGVLALVLLMPAFAIWRNMEALAMIWGEALSRGMPSREAARAVLQPAFRVGAFVLFVLWALLITPGILGGKVVFLAVALAATLLFVFTWRHMIRWHSHAEIALNEVLTSSGGTQRRVQEAFEFNASERWNLHVREFRVGDASRAAGQTLAGLPLRRDFECSIASIDRRGFVISNPPAHTTLYPEDIVLLIGAPENLDRAENWLEEPVIERGEDAGFAELQLGQVEVPPGSPAHGEALAALGLSRLTGALIVGIERGTKQMHNPGGETALNEGDQLLVLGRPDQIRKLSDLIRPSGGTAAG